MYIPLFNKSNYTLLSSLLKIDDLIEYAKKNNLSCIALTDTNMYGTMEFIKKCEKNDIKSIIGLHIILENYSLILLEKSYVSFGCAQDMQKLPGQGSNVSHSSNQSYSYARSLTH